MKDHRLSNRAQSRSATAFLEGGGETDARMRAFDWAGMLCVVTESRRRAHARWLEAFLGDALGHR